MAVSDIYQVTTTGVLQGQTCENVHHYQVTADADSAALATALFNRWFNTLLPALATFQSANWRWSEIKVQKIWPLPAFFPQVGSVSINGTEDGPAMPSEVAVVFKKTAFLAGSRYRGRMYIAGIPYEAMVTATGLWSLAYQGFFSTFELAYGVNVVTAPAGGVLSPVIYHRADHTATAVAGCRSTNVPRAQRRRQIGRGI